MLYSEYRKALRNQKEWAEEQSETWDCHYLNNITTTSGIRQTVLSDCNGYSRGNTCIITGINRKGQTLSVEAKTEYRALQIFIMAEGQNLSGHINITVYDSNWNCCFDNEDACHKALGRSLDSLPEITYPYNIKIKG